MSDSYHFGERLRNERTDEEARRLAESIEDLVAWADEARRT